MARLPWFRYGYMPDWLREHLIKALTKQQKQTIRTELNNLLVTAVQGSAGSLQLEVAQRSQSFLPNLANLILIGLYQIRLLWGTYQNPQIFSRQRL
ncbi:MAG: hypothetical protein F6K14_13205 [Symploca sp. SIO2C1]|nr:hypothetical protein [Symploca sp. SIO2C1]